jgi:hypothetical protein
LPAGALGILGINPHPIGTVEELKRLNLSLGANGSCAPSAGLPGHQPGVRGCPVYDRCPFHLKKLGGFKDHGPRNVGYYLRTHEGHAKEDFTPCYHFVATLVERMRAGQRDRENGKNGEIIEVIAQEGREDQKIMTKVWSPVDESNKALTAPYKMIRALVVVPKFPRPGEAGSDLSYDMELEQRRLKREAKDRDLETGLSGVREESKEEPWNPDAGVDLEAIGKTPVAEPVTKVIGRR